MMSSFDGDSSGWKDLPSSTPNKKRKELTCVHCKKVYVSQFHFNKHVQSHNQDTTTNTLADQSGLIQLNESDVSFSQLNDGVNNNEVGIFKVPTAAAPKTKRPKKTKVKPSLICTYCLKGYVCSRAFKSHQRIHSLQDAAAQYPDKDEIMANILKISSQALTLATNSPSFGESGAVFCELVGIIISISGSEEWKDFASSLSDSLLDSIMGKKVVLPSALLTNLTDRIETILSDPDFCDHLLSILKLPDKFQQGSTKSVFLLEFSINILKEMFAFISQTFRDRRPVTSIKANLVLDDDDKEVIYYIGGAIIRGYVRIAYRNKKSATWQEIVGALKARVLCDKPYQIKEAKWTLARDRGGLLYITSECQEFFLRLTGIVFASEKSDGSIDYEEVIGKAINSEVSILWDLMILDALRPEVSINLLNDVIKCFCRTCVRGFAQRRLNFLKQRPVVSMPMRHAVAKRKGK